MYAKKLFLSRIGEGSSRAAVLPLPGFFPVIRAHFRRKRRKPGFPGLRSAPGAVKEVPDSAGERRPASDRLCPDGQTLKTKKSRGIPTEPPGCYTGYMNTIPANTYTTLSTLNQLCLPINVGVLIPPDDSVRFLVFVLKQLDLTPSTRRIAHTAKGGGGSSREETRSGGAGRRETDRGGRRGREGSG
jgi:hypothetical protein